MVSILYPFGNRFNRQWDFPHKLCCSRPCRPLQSLLHLLLCVRNFIIKVIREINLSQAPNASHTHIQTSIDFHPNIHLFYAFPHSLLFTLRIFDITTAQTQQLLWPKPWPQNTHNGWSRWSRWASRSWSPVISNIKSSWGLLKFACITSGTKPEPPIWNRENTRWKNSSTKRSHTGHLIFLRILIYIYIYHMYLIYLCMIWYTLANEIDNKWWTMVVVCDFDQT